MKKAILAFILTMAVASQAFSDEIDEARELLAKEEGGDILYLSKINLGIPGGDNWIANRSDSSARIYVISDEKEVKLVDGVGTIEPSQIKYWDENSQSFTYFDDDIMQDIPGTRIGRNTTSFGDYNGDGIEEIFHIDPAIYLKCLIWGYDSDNGKEIRYLDESFEPISPKGPAPVVFANYRGTDGILIHTIYEERYVWVFFVWDERSRKFKRYMSIGADEDEMDWSMFTIIRNEDEFEKSASINSNNRNESFDDENGFRFYEMSPFPPSDSGNSRFIFYIAIAVGVIALAVALFFVVRRKKG